MKNKVNHIIEALKARYPDAPCALHYSKDYELMIAVRLSAQCTDARVNLITPELFATYPTLKAMATADIADVERIIHSCGFFRQKAKFVSKNIGKVRLDLLTMLPGFNIKGPQSVKIWRLIDG